MASRQISRHPSNASRTHLHPRDAGSESAHKARNKKNGPKTTSPPAEDDTSTNQRLTLQRSWALGGALRAVQDEPDTSPESPQKSDDSWNALNYLDPEQDATSVNISGPVQNWVAQTSMAVLDSRIRLERQQSRDAERDRARGQAGQAGPVDLRRSPRQESEASAATYPSENDLLNQPVFLRTLVPAGSTWSSLVGSGDEAAAWCSWRSPTEPLSEQKMTPPGDEADSDDEYPLFETFGIVASTTGIGSSFAATGSASPLDDELAFGEGNLRQ